MTVDEPESTISAVQPGAGRALYGQDPVSYAAGRPDYPERVYDVLVARCGLRRASRVVEIGPGTGLVTARMLSVGASVTGVEANTAMAQYLQETLGDTALDVIVAPFEDAPLADGTFDLAVAANSFHWVDQGVGLRKVRRVVVPGGWVAIWWMLFDDPTRPDELGPSLHRLLDEPSATEPTPGRPLSSGDDEARRAALQRAGLLGVESELIRTVTTMDAAQLRALYASMTIILSRPPGEQARLLDAIEQIVRDDFGGRVDRHFVTGLYTARNP